MSRAPLYTNPSRYPWNSRSFWGQKRLKGKKTNIKPTNPMPPPNLSGALNQKGKVCRSCRIKNKYRGHRVSIKHRSPDSIYYSVKVSQVYTTWWCLACTWEDKGTETGPTVSGISLLIPARDWVMGLFSLAPMALKWLGNLCLHTDIGIRSSDCGSSWNIKLEIHRTWFPFVRIGSSLLSAITMNQ